MQNRDENKLQLAAQQTLFESLFSKLTLPLNNRQKRLQKIHADQLNLPDDYTCKINYTLLERAIILDKNKDGNIQHDHIICLNTLKELVAQNESVVGILFWTSRTQGIVRNPFTNEPIKQADRCFELDHKIELYLLGLETWHFEMEKQNSCVNWDHPATQTAYQNFANQLELQVAKATSVQNIQRFACLQAQLQALLDNVNYHYDKTPLNEIALKYDIDLKIFSTLHLNKHRSEVCLIDLPVCINRRTFIDYFALQELYSGEWLSLDKNPLDQTPLENIYFAKDLHEEILTALIEKISPKLDTKLNQIKQEALKNNAFNAATAKSYNNIPTDLIDPLNGCLIKTPVQINHELILDLNSLIQYWQQHPEKKYRDPFSEKFILDIQFNYAVQKKLVRFLKNPDVHEFNAPIKKPIDTPSLIYSRHQVFFSNAKALLEIDEPVKKSNTVKKTSTLLEPSPLSALLKFYSK